MKSHNVIYVPTVHVVDTFAEERPGALEVSKIKARNLAKSHFAAYALALENGVTMAGGSDNAYRPGGSTVFDEVLTEVKYGMSPRKAIEGATVQGASLLGFDNLGALATGMEGDLIAVDGDPLTDIQAIKKVRFVIFRGKVITDKFH
jgi:imidazolonepropionase-like amidohydrolase